MWTIRLSVGRNCPWPSSWLVHDLEQVVRCMQIKQLYIHPSQQDNLFHISSCSLLCWSTFSSNYSIKSCYKVGTPIFRLLPLFFAELLKLYQVGWSVHRDVQIQSVFWLGHSKTFTVWSESHFFVIFAVCCWKVKSALEQVIVKALYIAAFINCTLLVPD